jgi:uncharacterized protein (TIGR02147 family)
MEKLNLELPTFALVLRDELCRRQRENSKYSLRSFAKQLRIQAPTLSQVLKGKRKLPQKKAVEIADLLFMEPIQKHAFFQSLGVRSKASIPWESQAVELNEQDHFKIIAEWEHYAILSLLDFHTPKVKTKDWISKKLNISGLRTEQALSRLQRAGFVNTSKGGGLVSQVKSVKTSTDIVSSALKASHLESFDIAKEKLRTVDLDHREFRSMTIAFSKNKMDEAKKQIQKFVRDFAELFDAHKNQKNTSQEVYQLGIQFFPLTHIQKDEVK